MEFFLNQNILVSNFSANTYVVVFIKSILLLREASNENSKTCVKTATRK